LRTAIHQAEYCCLKGQNVEFDDGSEQHFDPIVYATGYRTTFPFLEKSVFDPETGASNLYRRMISVKHPGLIFAGLVQPVGPTIPLVEIQGRWLAAVLAKKVELPDVAVQQREVALHKKRQRETYLDTDRYMLEVDFSIYSRELKADIRSGKSGI
jgi:dimethylaniline monooxygenase (N-oxide forming)